MSQIAIYFTVSELPLIRTKHSPDWSYLKCTAKLQYIKLRHKIKKKKLLEHCLSDNFGYPKC